MGSKTPAFTGDLSFINKDESNINSKDHIAKVRAHVRNEYRHWKPGGSHKTSIASSETSRSTTSSSSAGPASVDSPSSVSNSELSSSSNDALFDEDSPATSVGSPERLSSKNDSPAAQQSLALIPQMGPTMVSRTFFDVVRGSILVLEKTSDPRKEHERVNQQHGTRPTSSKFADAVKVISDAKDKSNLVQSAPPPQRSKHESGKLLREIRNYNSNQKILQTYSLQSSIGGLRDDPFLSFPIESRRSVIEAADYWVNSWAPAQTPKYIKAGSWKPTSDKVFSITTADEGAFESQVALAQSYLSRNGGKGEKPTKEVLYHQSRAMLSLRKHLEAGSVSAGPLLSSLNLLIMSIVHGDRKAYDFHRKGLEYMIQTPPENSTTGLLHAVIKGYFVTSRFYFQLLKFQTRPTQQTLLNPKMQTANKLTYPRHPFYPALSADVATLPSGFRELTLELSLPIQLIEVLKLIAHWNSIIAPKPEDKKSTQGVGVWFSWDDTERALEILEQLSTSTSSRNALAYALCMVLMLYSITAHNRFHATKIYVRLVQDAIVAIHKFYPTSKTQRECKLWMSVVVSGCARDAGAGNARIETNGVLRDLASSLADDFNTSSSGRYNGAAARKEHQRQQRNTQKALDWDVVETIMKEFFWYEHFSQTWRKCWELEVETSVASIAR